MLKFILGKKPLIFFASVNGKGSWSGVGWLVSAPTTVWELVNVGIGYCILTHHYSFTPTSNHSDILANLLGFTLLWTGKGSWNWFRWLDKPWQLRHLWLLIWNSPLWEGRCFAMKNAWADLRSMRKSQLKRDVGFGFWVIHCLPHPNLKWSWKFSYPEYDCISPPTPVSLFGFHLTTSVCHRVR